MNYASRIAYLVVMEFRDMLILMTREILTLLREI